MITSMNEIKPSELTPYEVLDDDQKALCILDHVAGHPEWYSWIFYVGAYYPHRKPTAMEIANDKFF